MSGSDLVEKGLEVFLNGLQEPVASTELYEQLNLKGWSINWRYYAEEPTYKWHGLVQTVLNIKHTPGDELEPSGGPDAQLYENHQQPFHEVFYMVHKLMEEGRVPKGIVYDKLVERTVLGQKVKVKVKASALYFYGKDMANESSECHWRITRWWHSYGDLPWVISHDNCPCDACEKNRIKKKEYEADRLLYSQFSKLVKSFKNAVREHANGRCQVCNEVFDTMPPHTKRHSYRCIPKFRSTDALEDIGLNHFRAICNLCDRRGL